MSSVLRAQKANAAAAGSKAKGKRKVDDMDVDEPGVDGEPARKKKNKQRVLLLSSRGITHRMRHFMNDLEALLPHVKKGARSNVPCVSLAGSLQLARCKARL
jgi:ribosome biogenesis protein BRX1